MGRVVAINEALLQTGASLSKHYFTLLLKVSTRHFCDFIFTFRVFLSTLVYRQLLITEF